jgi:hypothetical protein
VPRGKIRLFLEKNLIEKASSPCLQDKKKLSLLLGRFFHNFFYLRDDI